MGENINTAELIYFPALPFVCCYNFLLEHSLWTMVPASKDKEVTVGFVSHFTRYVFLLNLNALASLIACVFLGYIKEAYIAQRTKSGEFVPQGFLPSISLYFIV